jgi:hypothetical protein
MFIVRNRRSGKCGAFGISGDTERLDSTPAEVVGLGTIPGCCSSEFRDKFRIAIFFCDFDKSARMAAEESRQEMFRRLTAFGREEKCEAKVGYEWKKSLQNCGARVCTKSLEKKKDTGRNNFQAK